MEVAKHVSWNSATTDKQLHLMFLKSQGKDMFTKKDLI